ncbi:MAG: beta-lactamase family protein [Bacteroidota bacterium]|nr:beta-lactamase family protein [Bacteroidota bacterium]
MIIGLPAQSQNLAVNLNNQVDSLFSDWNHATPGCVIGIVRNDSLIYTKGYGMANLEYDIPNTPSAIYDIGSVSKQFTAYCILLLAQQHKLSLDDDIHKYINWLKIKDKITVRNLLNHTSGIREYFQLLAILGKSGDDAFTQELAIHALKGQQMLNYMPGEKFLYSNSNYLLLAEIIKKVSGQTLRSFADSAIFKPLKMNDAYFSDDYTEIQKNRAYSYKSAGKSHYVKAFGTDSDVGAGNLFCNVKDMAKWVTNFYTTTAGNSATVKMLTQKGKLKNGNEISYAAGINVSDYKGWALYIHTGESAGFNTCVSIFPKLKMGFIVFTNLDNVNALDKNFAIADLYLPKKEIKEAVIIPKKIDSVAAINNNLLFIRRYIGKAITGDGTKFEFAVNNKRLYFVQNNDSELLVKESQNTFYQASQPDKKFVFSTTSSGARVADEYWPKHSERFYIKTQPDLVDDKKLKTYAGIYHCAELNCNYTISIKNHELLLSSNIYDNAPLWLDGDSDLFNNFWGMSHLVFIRNQQHQITGFEVNCSRVLHLLFSKTTK